MDSSNDDSSSFSSSSSETTTTSEHTNISKEDQEWRQEQQPRFNSVPIHPHWEGDLVVIQRQDEDNKAKCRSRSLSPTGSTASGAAVDHELERKRKKANELEGKLLQQYYNEEDVLRKAYRSTCCSNTDAASSRPLTLITSPSDGDCGRFVKQALTPSIRRDNANLVVGTFQEHSGNLIPFGGFRQAMAELLKASANSGSAIATTTNALNFCTRDKQVLVSMMPCLEPLIQAKEESSSSEGKNTDHAGFIMAFCKLLKSMATKAPLVLVLENLQWADNDSIDLLVHLVRDLAAAPEEHDDNCNLMLIATCNESLVQSETPSCHAGCKLKELVVTGGHLGCHISLFHYRLEQIDVFLWETLRLHVEGRELLTKLVKQQTGGSLYGMVDFLRWLLLNRLKQDPTSWSETWIYTSGEQPLPPVLGGFLQERLTSLPPTHLELLQVTACLVGSGATVEQQTLDAVVMCADTVDGGLSYLEQADLLTCDLEDDTTVNCHSGVNQAAYQLLSEAKREEMHRAIGRRLWESLQNETDLERHMFDILSHLYLGRALILEEQERLEVATLCCQAGAKAAKASAFQSSAFYLRFGMDMLPERHWEKASTYDLSLALYTAAAEVHMCGSIADFAEVHRLLDIILAKTRTTDEKIQANSIRMYAFSLQGKHLECLELGVRLLKKLGITFPKSLSKVFLLPDMLTVGRYVRRKTNGQILGLPQLTNKKKLLTLQVLNHMILPSILNNPDMTPFVLIKQTVITLKYGLSVFASIAFGTYGMFRIVAADDVVQATRFQEMAKVLLERFGANEYLPRVTAAVYGCTTAFTRPPTECLEPLLYGHRVGKGLGDSEYGCLCANLYFLLSSEGGLPFSVLDKFWPIFDEMASCPERHAMTRVSIPTADLVDRLKGKLADPLSPTGNYIDYDVYFGEAVEAGSTQNQLEIHYCWMRLGYIFGDYQIAEKHCLRLSDVDDIPPTIERIGVQFWIGLVSIQAAQQGRHRAKNLRLTRQICGKLKKWAKHAPTNVLDRKSLLEAELAVAVGDDALARERYRLAVLYTEDSKSVMVRALAEERMARLMLLNNEVDQAKFHLEASSKAYREWGATGKAVRLDDEIRALSA